MTESSPLQSVDEHQLLQAALEHPFEPADVTHPSSPSVDPAPAPPPQSTTSPSETTPDDTWQATYSAQVSEWRAQSASARTKAEQTRAKWESIRAREEAERTARGEPRESFADLGEHLTTSAAAATETVAHSLAASVASLSSIEHVESPEKLEESAQDVEVQLPKRESGSPSQRWEHISPSPTSSYPSMSFPEASVPHSPAPQPAVLGPSSGLVSVDPLVGLRQNQTYIPPSTLPSIMDDRIQPQTRVSLVLSSLAINLLLPFINGVMLGFGEIFAKDVVVGWFGWKSRPGSTSARLGLWR